MVSTPHIDPWSGLMKIEENLDVFYPIIEKGISLTDILAQPEHPNVNVSLVLICAKYLMQQLP
jgi:hypothetical protein